MLLQKSTLKTKCFNKSFKKCNIELSKVCQRLDIGQSEQYSTNTSSKTHSMHKVPLFKVLPTTTLVVCADETTQAVILKAFQRFSNTVQFGLPDSN